MDELPQGFLLRSYRIESVVERGATTIVYAATDMRRFTDVLITEFFASEGSRREVDGSVRHNSRATELMNEFGDAILVEPRVNEGLVEAFSDLGSIYVVHRSESNLPRRMAASAPIRAASGTTPPSRRPLSLGEMLGGLYSTEAPLESPPPPTLSARRAEDIPTTAPHATMHARRSGPISFALVTAAAAAALLAAGDRLVHFAPEIFTLVAKLLKLSATPPLPRHVGNSTDVVDFSVFAPPAAGLGEAVLVQVFLHDPNDPRIPAMAEASDMETSRRGTSPLLIGIERGERLEIAIDGLDLKIEDSFQLVAWQGRPSVVQFLVRIPKDFSLATAHLRVRVLKGSIPIGQLRFSLPISSAPRYMPLDPMNSKATRFSRAFLSYASADRIEVLKRAQALQAAKIEVFQDILSLRAGEEWEKRLYGEIDRCDLFLLFWSQAARDSEWVAREVDYALDRQKLAQGLPEIMPVILEGPPPPEPPERFRNLHFNDAICYVIAAHQASSR